MDRLVTKLLQELDSLRGDSGIRQEPHAELSAKRVDFVVGKRRSVGEGLTNIFFVQLWQVRDDLRGRHAVGDEIHHVRDGDAQAADRGAAPEHARVLGDSFEGVRHDLPILTRSAVSGLDVRYYREPMGQTDASTFLGYWKITEMETWAQTYVDLVVPGFFEFAIEDERLVGSFQFGTVVGWLDCRHREVNGALTMEWSWDGRNDTDPGCGRGWATVVDGELVGHFFIHCGDGSAFKARRRSRPTTRPPAREQRKMRSVPH